MRRGWKDGRRGSRGREVRGIRKGATGKGLERRMQAGGRARRKRGQGSVGGQCAEGGKSAKGRKEGDAHLPKHDFPTIRQVRFKAVLEPRPHKLGLPPQSVLPLLEMFVY